MFRPETKESERIHPQPSAHSLAQHTTTIVHALVVATAGKEAQFDSTFTDDLVKLNKFVLRSLRETRLIHAQDR